jgi:hypothetical protein
MGQVETSSHHHPTPAQAVDHLIVHVNVIICALSITMPDLKQVRGVGEAGRGTMIRHRQRQCFEKAPPG